MLQSESSLGAPIGSVSILFGSVSNRLEVRERADVGCVLVNAAIDAANILDAAGAAAGVALPASAGSVSRGSSCSAIWLTPRSWLVPCHIEDEFDLVSRINAVFADKRLHAVLFTDYLCWLELRGETVEELIQQGGFISMERGGLAVGHAKRTLLASITAVIVHQSEFEWLVAIERSRADYFLAWLEHSSS